MRHLTIINAIEKRSENFHATLWNNEAKRLSLTNRINQVGGMLELAELLPQPMHKHLIKALRKHLNELAALRQKIQSQNSG